MDIDKNAAIRAGRYRIKPQGKGWPGLWNVIVEDEDGLAWDVAHYGSRQECRGYVRGIRGNLNYDAHPNER